jgi:hypothetical protein
MVLELREERSFVLLVVWSAFDSQKSGLGQRNTGSMVWVVSVLGDGIGCAWCVCVCVYVRAEEAQKRG